MPFEKGKSGNPAGRPVGIVPKIQRELKEMILGALSDAGGQEYLARQAEANPGAFMQLVGKVLPMTVTGTGENGKIVIEWQKPSES